MSVIIPNSYWYKKKSLDKGLGFHCPFTSVKLCPCYCQSIALMREASGVGIDLYDDNRLLNSWKKSDLWPKTKEQEASIAGPSRRINQFNNFCPEVLYKIFGYFASYISEYSDLIDWNIAQRILKKENAPYYDWRWRIANLTPQHYTECDLYTVLKHRGAKHKKLWYKKPYGIIILGVIITVIGGLILLIIEK